MVVLTNMVICFAYATLAYESFLYRKLIFISHVGLKLPKQVTHPSGGFEGVTCPSSNSIFLTFILNSKFITSNITCDFSSNGML